jgi:DNA excision repair protein ERCC-8
VRLVDLRSGSAVQTLLAPGQTLGAVLSTAWSPRHEHVLVSGSTDGAVRVWDVRRASALVALLDREDSLGLAAVGRGDAGHGAASVRERGMRESARAHAGPVNGLAWTDDGNYIVSAGHDARIRVWDAATGANTLVSFGPLVKNGGLSSVTMFTSPSGMTAPKTELLFWPNESEIIVFDLHKGTIVSRLKGFGSTTASSKSQQGGQRTVKNRVTSVVWRGAGGYGASSGIVMGGRDAAGGIFSAHMDGQIRGWMPRLEGRDDEDEDNPAEEVDGRQERKRKAINDAYRSLMGQQITFK